jgi:hypothetical protein
MMGPFVMGPFVMGPFVMGPLMMVPYVGVPQFIHRWMICCYSGSFDASSPLTALTYINPAAIFHSLLSNSKCSSGIYNVLEIDADASLYTI